MVLACCVTYLHLHLKTFSYPKLKYVLIILNIIELCYYVTIIKSVPISNILMVLTLKKKKREELKFKKKELVYMKFVITFKIHFHSFIQHSFTFVRFNLRVHELIVHFSFCIV